MTATNESGDKNYKFKVEIPVHATPPTSPGGCDSPVPAAAGAHRASKIEIDGYSFALAQTVESLKATTTGIDTYPLEFVPAVTLTPDPQQIMVPAEARLATAHAAYPRPLPWNETCKSFSGS